AELRLSNSGSVIPKLDLDSGYKNYFKSTRNLLYSIFKRNKCKIVKHINVDKEGQSRDGISFSTTHMIGSCRMADSKSHGVVDPFGEIFDYPGIYITDGAAVPTSLAVNSSLTILANAERIAHHLVEKFSAYRKDSMNISQNINSGINH
ncbi:MAG: GMC family oxidoreductase, partial [Ignavibacteriaceae bacterium]